MPRCYYQVAEHAFCIQHGEAFCLDSQLPSFIPFKLQDEPSEVLFTAVVDDLRELCIQGREIGQFDCGGCNHGVYALPDGGYQIVVSDTKGDVCSVLKANSDFTSNEISVCSGTLAQSSFGLNNAMMMAYAFATADRLTMLMHSSVIRWDGKGYMMTAPSGTGKSTHTRLWYDNIPGCDLMNDDNPVVRIVDGTPMVYGSPWSGKTPCYRNISAPVGAIVRIQQRPHNEIRRVSTLEAFGILLSATSSMKWDKRVYTGICDGISALIGGCGIFELGCLPDADAAVLCHATVIQG